MATKATKTEQDEPKKLTLEERVEALEQKVEEQNQKLFMHRHDNRSGEVAILENPVTLQDNEVEQPKGEAQHG